MEGKGEDLKIFFLILKVETEREFFHFFFKWRDGGGGPDMDRQGNFEILSNSYGNQPIFNWNGNHKTKIQI